ncbi:hypothetical protein AB0L62_07915 [Nocardia asteroides]|uniref:hypothetical protein n=1 Tax=Nocardia asteroides TaxID=1824 RepID=UPI0034499FC8
MNPGPVSKASGQRQFEVVWPPRIVRPSRPPALVYLDQNHFINLARAVQGTAPLGYDVLLDACRRSRAESRALFPLSMTHCFEVASITDPKQRSKVAAVMEELSDFRYLPGRDIVARLEIEAMLDTLSAPAGLGGEPIPLLGTSMLFAFGNIGSWVVRNSDGSDADATEFQDQIDEFTRKLEQRLLAGPADEDLPALQQLGYTHQGWRGVSERRAEQEREQVERFDAEPKWRKERLRDAIAVRELTIEWMEAITAALMARGTSIGQVIGDQQRIRRFTEGMPSICVAVSLKARYHSNPQHRWTVNDIHDIDAMAVAVPYCDAVFTDSAVKSSLDRSPELRVFNTFVPRRPTDLANWLDGRTADGVGS